jgi:predicted DNA-binding transcriptional regulator AlpA
MSLVTQAFVFERYGPRLDMIQLAALLDIEKTTLYNKISAKTCPVKTYMDQGKRWADYRDVADHFDAMRAQAR